MVVGILELKLAMRASRSLKDKRRVVNSLRDRIANKHNVSIAEVENQEMRQVAALAVVQAGSDARYVRGSLEKIVSMVRKFRGAQLTDYRIEVLHH